MPNFRSISWNFGLPQPFEVWKIVFFGSKIAIFRGLWKSEILWYHSFFASYASSHVSIPDGIAMQYFSLKNFTKIGKSWFLRLYRGLTENDDVCVKWPKKYLDRLYPKKLQFAAYRQFVLVTLIVVFLYIVTNCCVICRLSLFFPYFQFLCSYRQFVLVQPRLTLCKTYISIVL